jgi:Ca2+-binding EF-hand superfamily protein
MNFSFKVGYIFQPIKLNFTFDMGNSKGLESIKKLNGMEISEEEINQVFESYDKNKDGNLQREEATTLLKEVLTFYSKKAKEEFKKAKEDQGGLVTLEDEEKFNQAVDVEKNLKVHSGKRLTYKLNSKV